MMDRGTRSMVEARGAMVRTWGPCASPTAPCDIRKQATETTCRGQFTVPTADLSARESVCMSTLHC